ncbi:MAG: DUF2335 domain-containing protein [bacterium]|nr:DUF2335 domain-containing protein [bacterium]
MEDNKSKTLKSKVVESDTPSISESPELLALIQRVKYTSGPIPSPEGLKEYKEVDPSFPERIFNIAEKVTEYRIDSNKKRLEFEIKKGLKGQSIASIIAVLYLAGAVFCAYIGAHQVGSIIGGVTLVSVVPMFLYRRKRNGNKETKTGQNTSDKDKSL